MILQFMNTVIMPRGLLLIALLFPATAIIYTSLFDSTIQSPANIYRIYSTSLTDGTTKTFTVTYPVSFNTTPIVLYSITSLTFGKDVYFDLLLTTISLTSVTAQFRYSSITQVAFSFLIMDSSLYPATLTNFLYQIPPETSTPQSITITNNSLHTASYMVGLNITFGSVATATAIGADSVVVNGTISTIFATNLTISYDPSQVSVNVLRMYFVDFNSTSFLAPSGLSYGQQFMIYGTNGYATDQSQINSLLSVYTNNFMTGLQTIYSVNFINQTYNFKFDITKFRNYNTTYYTAELIFVSYYCPSGFPVTDTSRTYCYSRCDIGFYANGQMICSPCDSNCYTCIGLATNCTGCKLPYVLSYGFVCACTTSAYQITHSNGSFHCIDCSSVLPNCQSCTSNRNCIQCMSNMVLLDPLSCVCPDGTRSNIINLSTYCVNDIPVIEESCPGNMTSVNNVCSCINLTLISGTCQ